MIRWLDRLALAATLLLPVFILHGRAVAECLIVAVDALFLIRSAVSRDWGWLRPAWVRIAAAFWIWLVVCSIPGIGAGGFGSLGQAIAFIRLLLLPAALEWTVLRQPAARLWLWRMLAACAVYIGGQTVLQLTTGRDIQGFPRWGDGSLTGPFEHPRAAAPLSRLLFPTLLPPLSALLARRRWMASVAATVLTALSVAVMVLIGQRMPLLLTLLGMLLAGLLLPRLRGPVIVAIVAGAVLLMASAALSPPTYYRLVEKFSAQMANFPDSNYGQIAGRAIVITLDHPLFGRGYDGFRNTCADPATFRGLAWAGQHEADGGGLAGCNIHPHNHYLEAATEAGIPGLLLFAALVVAWLTAAGRGLARNPDPLRVGLFVSLFIHEWPVASTGGFAAMDLSGFFFVLLGFALAESRAVAPARLPRLHDLTAPVSPRERPA